LITENLSTLKIHKLTQAQYDRELAAGRIDENALYLTPDEEVDMSIYATVDQLDNKADSEHTHEITDVINLQPSLDKLFDDSKKYTDSVASTNYNESIIGLSIDGQVITYIKGDGSKHTFVTQDTDTTYSLGTDEVTGLTKLYATTGSAEDGTMTQKAIKTELDKKVGVSVDNTNDMLIFTI
jgi:hypothetical protein